MSITVVLAGHLTGTRNFPRHTSALMGLAEIGVRIFFVISGYLISTLLFRDRERIEARALSTRHAFFRFYVRRVFRIFPAGYLFISIVTVLAAAGRIRLLAGDVTAAATFTTNFHHPRAWWLGHLWSLSVEEQFYFIWPAVALLGGKRTAIRVAALALVAAPATRVFIWFAAPGLRDYIDESFPTVFDVIATGCILAGARDWLGKNDAYLRFLRSPTFVLVPIFLVTASLLAEHSRFDLVLGQCVQNFTVALIVDRSIRFPQLTSGRILNSRPLIFIGSLSYSIFLWQQLFLNRHSTSWTASFPANLLFAFSLALASYYLVEQPARRFRARHFPSPQLRGTTVPQGSSVGVLGNRLTTDEATLAVHMPPEA